MLTKMGQELEEWQLGIKRLPAPQASMVQPDILYLLRRLLSNQHTLSGPEFREELARIVETAYSAPQADQAAA